MTKSKGIIFGPDSIRAIREGWKCQTRRIAKPGRPCPYPAGSVLYVKEKWAKAPRHEVLEVYSQGLYLTSIMEPHPSQLDAIYAEDFEADPLLYTEIENPRWRSPLFMPRWAARLWLEVTAVRQEHVQDISREDAIAEGAHHRDFGRNKWKLGDLPGWSMLHPHPGDPDHCLGSAEFAYANLWNKINGSKPGCAWSDNPLVHVIEFRQIEAPLSPSGAVSADGEWAQ